MRSTFFKDSELLPFSDVKNAQQDAASLDARSSGRPQFAECQTASHSALYALIQTDKRETAFKQQENADSGLEGQS